MVKSVGGNFGSSREGAKNFQLCCCTTLGIALAATNRTITIMNPNGRSRQRNRTMKRTALLFTLVAAVGVTREVVCFVTPPPNRAFGIQRIPRVTTTIQQSAATLDAPTVTPVPPKKKEKVTPEATELTQVFEEKELGESQYKYVVAQTAPSVRIAFSEVFGKEPGAFKADLLVSSLKAIGFDLVLDTNTAADLTICEEGQELLERIMAREEAKETGEIPAKPLPLFTSCCPGWMKLVQKSAPELNPYISTCKSPHMSKFDSSIQFCRRVGHHHVSHHHSCCAVYGAVLKKFSKELMDCEPEEIYMCSVMPCVRKRGESDEPVFQNSKSGVREVDNVITTKDLGAMLQAKGIDPLDLKPMQYDSPFQSKEAQGSGLGTGAGQLFGATGGVMEAAVRSVYELVTGAQLPRLELNEVRGLDDVKEATVRLFNEETGRGLDLDLNVAVVNGLGNAKKLLAKMKSGDIHYDFVEVMACPGVSIPL